MLTTNIGVTTTYFVGNYYEVANGVVTKYYYAGAQRIAMRTGGTLNYILGDHLGSTSLVASATGTVVSQQFYKAWGEVRYASATLPTKYTYTGQYSHVSDFGLMFYNARWYDPSLGRFAQADTIIPGGVQGLDRYAYVQNNPVRYTDPTGHRNCEEDGYNCPGDKGPFTVPTPAATPSLPTPTATPACSVCNNNQYAQMLYNAVVKHKSDLPSGFSVALLFAMAAVESGGNKEPYRNSTTHGGAFQLRNESGHYHEPYADTPEGYEQNVIDAMALINENYNNAEATKKNLAFNFLYVQTYPNNPNEVTAARAVLYYNGGMGWLDPSNPNSYVNNPINKPYAGNVANMLDSYVPKNFGFSDPTLANILHSVQAVVNAYIP